MNVKDLKKFEQNIGYSFKDIEHLKIALTHKSYIDEDPTSKTNQRYEFIGDTILDFDLSIFLGSAGGAERFKALFKKLWIRRLCFYGTLPPEGD